MIQDLVIRSKKGDKKAYGEIVEKYYSEMFLLAISIVKNSYDADDVCQEAFIKVYKKLGKIKKPGSFKSYLSSVVWNEAKDFYRKNKKEKTVEKIEFKGFCSDQTEEKLILFENLMKLKRDYTEILVLRYFQDMKLKDIQKILNIPLSTVKSRIRYALEEMRKEMEDVQNER